jgi:hypothetical protein
MTKHVGPYEQIVAFVLYGECLLLFSPKSFVFPSYIKNPKIKIYKTVILPVVLYGCETWSHFEGGTETEGF